MNTGIFPSNADLIKEFPGHSEVPHFCLSQKLHYSFINNDDYIPQGNSMSINNHWDFLLCIFK